MLVNRIKYASERLVKRELANNISYFGHILILLSYKEFCNLTKEFCKLFSFSPQQAPTLEIIQPPIPIRFPEQFSKKKFEAQVQLSFAAFSGSSDMLHSVIADTGSDTEQEIPFNCQENDII